MFSHWTESCARLTIEAVRIPMGGDLCVVITGGSRPHLGAVAVAQARPSLEDPAQVSATTSVLTLVGHKDDIVARRAAETLAARLNRNVVVCCGIHVDRISADELQFVDAALDRFCASVTAQSV